MSLGDISVGTLITAMLGSGVLVAFVDWLKTRRTTVATAKLTDFQTLQAQLAYVEGVSEYLRKHNDDLQNDYTQLEEKYRKQRERLNALEEEIMRVRISAAQAQADCESLGKRLQQVLEGEGG